MQANTDFFAEAGPETLPAIVRLRPIVSLDNGAPFATLSETDRAFDSGLRFAQCSACGFGAEPGAWLGEQIAAGARAMDLYGFRPPLIVPACPPALISESVAEACETAATRSQVCPQEICLEFEDGLFAADLSASLDGARRLLRRGFRISLDARRSWTAAGLAAFKVMGLAVRLDARNLDTTQVTGDATRDAAASGLAVMIEGMRWRDGADLATRGIHMAIAPRSDA
jgi:hypothetical protein